MRRQKVAFHEAVALNHRGARSSQVVGTVRQLDPRYAAGIEESTQVRLQSKNCQPPRSLVTTHALEHRGAELHRETQDVNLRFTPRDELTVPPNPLAFWQSSGHNPSHLQL